MATTLAALAVKSFAENDRSLAYRAVDQAPRLRTNVSSAERWASLAGGVALLGAAARQKEPSALALLSGGFLLYRAITGNCPVSQAFGFSMSDATAKNSVIAAGHGSRIVETITVAKPIAEVYHFWRDFENLPRFMTHLIDVETTADGRSHWTARGPFGLRVEWDAEMIVDTKNQLISWKSLPNADVDMAGSVHFRDLGQGARTEVTVELKYDPPAGKAGTLIAKLVGRDPQQQIREDLSQFKRVIESTPTVA